MGLDFIERLVVLFQVWLYDQMFDAVTHCCNVTSVEVLNIIMFLVVNITICIIELCRNIYRFD